MSKTIQRFSVAVLFVAAMILVSGCATRKYVRQEIGTIEPRITEVRNTQAEQAERIDAVDRRAQEGLTAAIDAAMAAETANERAVAADRRAANADRVAEAANVNAQRALSQIDTVEKNVERHIDTVEKEMAGKIANLDKYTVADRSTVTFKFDSDVLGKEAISKLDDIAGWVSGTQSGYLIELQGYTDSAGTDKYNFGLSERRADSVLRYLASKGVPVHRISIVGFGKTSPVADNKTAGGREQNRRVEVRVLRSGTGVATANR